MQSNSQVQQIKDRLDIVDVISNYLKLEKTGINLRACCPFHQEKTPSFFVSPQRQSFKCFGCGKFGDAFTFVQEIEGVEFIDALKILAKKAGVELSHSNFSQTDKTKHQVLFDILEIATQFFEKQLQGQKGKEVLKYLNKRGLTEQTIKKWRLGLSPNTWGALNDFLISRGFSADNIFAAGLTVKSQKTNRFYDRFRGRIIFPVFDFNSQVVGFGARVLGTATDTAKYINTPSTALYDKSRTLYGLNFAKLSLRQKDAAILTEGYMDVILSHQANFENTVAASGTSLTNLQLKVLKRYTNNLLTAFDMDLAGGMATQRGIALAQQEGFNIKVITMAKDKDPADIILQNPELWQKAVSGAVDIMDFYFQKALSNFDKQTPQGKKQIAQYILPQIKNISNQIVQSHFVQKLAGVLNTKEDIIFSELAKTTLTQEKQYNVYNVREEIKNPLPIANRQALLEEQKLVLICKDPTCLNIFCDERNKNYEYVLSEVEQALDVLKKENPSTKAQVENILENFSLENANLKKLFSACLFKAELQEFDDVLQAARFCQSQWLALVLKKQRQKIAIAIREAESNGKQNEVIKLVEQFNTLSKQI